MTNATPVTSEELVRSQGIVNAIGSTLTTRLVGQQRLTTALLVSLLAEGHALVESVPGLAKTLAASTLAQALSGSFSRIQCTPDLLPSDIIGTQVYDARTAEFETRLGPVHANIVLLDEINRSSAKTQSAMLEAMQERQTSIGGVVYPLPQPFMVLATQNPIEEEGTYVLPQAQLDRFLLKVVIDYPTAGEEVEVLRRIESGVIGAKPQPVAAVASTEDLAFIQDVARRIFVADTVKHYIVEVVRATRQVEQVLGPEQAAYVEFGASPRGAIAFLQVARAIAFLQGRDHVVPEDVRQLAHEVLRHRIILSFEAMADRVRPETLIDAILAAVPTP